MGAASDTTTASLLDVLRRTLDEAQTTSGADIVSLYLYDAQDRRYYAPVAIGIPEAGLLDSIPDIQDQLARYLADEAQGKAPEELHPQQYGPNVWLTVTRKPLITRNAPEEIGSSFVRRHHIRSIIGLPLVAADTLVGLLYLDFADKPGHENPIPAADDSDAYLAELVAFAERAAARIESARKSEERTAFLTACHLTSHLSSTSVGAMATSDGLSGRLSAALQHLIAVTDFEAALVYRVAEKVGLLQLVAQHGLADAPAYAPIAGLAASGTAAGPSDAVDVGELQGAVHAAGLSVAGTLPLCIKSNHGPDTADGSTVGYLLVLSSDQLAFLRRTPSTRLLLQLAAELIAGSLASQHLILTLEDANRVLGALSRMSGLLLRPGSTRQEVLDAVVRHLIDSDAPEFAFQFATIFLLSDRYAKGNAAEDGLTVHMAAGAAYDEQIDALPGAGEKSAQRVAPRIPRWVVTPNRAVASTDVLAFALREGQIVVIAALPEDDRGLVDTESIVEGYPREYLDRKEIPAIRADGSVSATVTSILIGNSSGSMAGMQGSESRAVPFTLDGDIFDTNTHRDLIRMFVPFGLSSGGPATGVLEAGYHRSHKSHVHRTQIEALRAAASQVAVAVETARLYEDAKRHAEQLETIADVSKAMAASIDLDQTLRIIAKNLVRTVDASLCQIALYEDDGSAWYGAAASSQEALWRRQRGEHPESSFFFDLIQTRKPFQADDVQSNHAINSYYAHLFGIRSLLALPLIARGHPIGVAVLAQCDAPRTFSEDEVKRAEGLADQAAIAIQNAHMYASAEEDVHIQRDVVLVGFGEWGQKAYDHLLTLKQFFNFKIHIAEQDTPARREALDGTVARVVKNGDAIYWGTPENPVRDQLRRELESSCYVITYIATPGSTHLPVLAQYYDLSNVVVIEKPLGATAEAYRKFLDSVEAGVQIVAADHYYFKLEVRLLQLLLTEERTLKSFLDEVEEIEMELVEERPLSGAAADIGIIEDMMPHAFAIISLFTPIDRIQFSPEQPLYIGRQEPIQGQRESYARIRATFPHGDRTVRLIIDVGKGVENSKWIKLSGEKRLGGRPAFYKFDFAGGYATDSTQTNLRAAIREIRQPGVPDNAHLTMLRHVIEKRYPAVGILAIREAMRSNQRIQELVDMASGLLAEGNWTSYQQGRRPLFPDAAAPDLLLDGRGSLGVPARAG